jgi:hypothetical protein
MSTTPKAPGFTILAGIGLSVLILLAWVGQLATLSDLSGSDPAGNALAQAFGALEIIVLWGLLAVLALLAATRGAMPRAAALAITILIPASGFAAMTAAELLAEPGVAPFMWPIIIPALVPSLIVTFCFWALLPSMRATVPVGIATGIGCGATLVLCLSILPMVQIRDSAIEREAALRTKWEADFTKLTANSPLWVWAPFLATRDETKRSAVLDRIRHLDRRQNDAEVMLDRGDFPLLYLGSFDLDPTSAVCDKARDLLRRRVQPLASKSPNSRPYAEIAGEVAGAVAAMDWLVGYGCSCDAESLAWETMAKSYRNPNFDVVRLTELRDPENLGRALREHPARFSMLTQQAPLKAWLNFADEEGLREQVFAGARKLDHRTSDAIEMLGEDEYTAQTMLRYLPVLDLDATPQLCEAAHQVLHRQFAQIYRPKADDPRPYRELLSRLGDGAQFSALRWLAEHGCAVAAELSDAESLVRAYQDSPERAAMLATLAQLRR